MAEMILAATGWLLLGIVWLAVLGALGYVMQAA